MLQFFFISSRRYSSFFRKTPLFSSLFINNFLFSKYILFCLDNIRPYYYSLRMADLHKKVKKGRPYYYICEMARVDGKPKVVNQVYLGSVERILSMSAGEKAQLEKIQVQEFGALWLADKIEQDVTFVSSNSSRAVPAWTSPLPRPWSGCASFTPACAGLPPRESLSEFLKSPPMTKPLPSRLSAIRLSEGSYRKYLHNLFIYQ